jgi:DNA repair exonuclease SbcCD ATPase subunit/DNA repair exonuclease SbcCD nuclease subunit
MAESKKPRKRRLKRKARPLPPDDETAGWGKVIRGKPASGVPPVPAIPSTSTSSSIPDNYVVVDAPAQIPPPKGSPLLTRVDPPTGYVLFGDLHVSSATLDRAVEVLRRVRALAVERRLHVVCLGDFWHGRGALSVRQLTVLLDEFDKWLDAGVAAHFVPGNHDQATANGLVHGVRPFAAYPNIVVATEPLRDRALYLPWREDPVEQSATFAAFEGEGGIVFGHAEVGGAVANNGREAPGRVSLSAVEAVGKAVYLGHFHMRQKLGSKVWYVGSPFEQRMDERDQPHGVALVSVERPNEPEWVDWADFPRHHRISFSGGKLEKANVREGDVVEVRVAAGALGTEAYRRAVAGIPTADVRPVPVRAAEEDTVPPLALDLEAALDAYVEQEADVEGWTSEELRALGREVLSEQKRDEAGPLTPTVRVAGLRVRDFCAVRGAAHVSFHDDDDGGAKMLGCVLVRGPVASGKTSLFDALTWCLYGTTTPRKAGASGASLKGDEVVNDHAESAEVSVWLRVDVDNYLVVTRKKRRGQAARLDLKGQHSGRPAAPVDMVVRSPGEAELLVQRAAGLTQDAWRACVHMGQGAVENFVTAADKRRKEMLSSAFDLGACSVASAHARKVAAVAESEAAKLAGDATREEGVLEGLRSVDYEAGARRWEADRKAAVEAAEASAAEASGVIEKCSAALGGEEKWLDAKRRHEQHVDKLTKRLGASTSSKRVVELQRQIGGVKAERDLAERDAGKMSAEYEGATEALQKGAVPCPTCGRPLDSLASSQHVADMESRITAKRHEVRSFDARLSNLTQELHVAQSSGTQERAAAEQEIAKSRAALHQCGEALSALAKIKANHQDAERRLREAREVVDQRRNQENPFVAQAKEAGERGAEAQERVAELWERSKSAARDARGARFWGDGFSARGAPVLVLRTALADLEERANHYLSAMLFGALHVRLSMEGDGLEIRYVEMVDGESRDRAYRQLSGGQRRCVELAFQPFALSEVLLPRIGVRVNLLVVDELTSHLGAAQKPVVCELLRGLDRSTVVVVDHDQAVQSEFDAVYDVDAGGERWALRRTR